MVPPGEVVVEAPLLGDDFVEMRPHTVPVQQYTVVVSYFILLSIEKVPN